MTANAICFASSKGGSGKTTVTATLATFLNETGKRVLMVDCEGTHGLTLMYLNEVNENRKGTNLPLLGVFDEFSELSSELIENSLVEIRPDLYLFPARHTFSEVDLSPVDKTFKSNLMMILEYATGKFDYILFDAQAGISAASRAAMSPDISDTVILVSEYDPMSNAGVERLKARLPDELDVGRTWILLNKLLPEFVSKFSEFLSVAKYLPPIPWTADVVRAYSRRKLALDFQGGNQFTLAVLNILRELLSDSERGDLEAWVETQTERLKEPISEQLADAQKLLEEMQTQASREISPVVEFKRRLFRMAYTLAPLAVALIGTLVVLTPFGDYSDPIKKVFGIVFPEGSSSVLFATLVLVVMFALTSILWMIRRTSSYEMEIKLRKKLEHGEEFAAVLKRIQELKELASSDYEEIVSRKHD